LPNQSHSSSFLNNTDGSEKPGNEFSRLDRWWREWISECAIVPAVAWHGIRSPYSLFMIPLTGASAPLADKADL
jgi:hypothetical protein